MRETVLNFEEIPDPSHDFTYDFVDEKLIAYVTRLARSSFEMGELFYIMKNFANLDKCLFYDTYTVDRFSSKNVELHHFPLKIHSVSETIANKHLAEKEHWSPFEAAEEVVECHFRFWIGLVPLSPTVHELVHSDVVSLHLEHVPKRFQWRRFVDEYGKWMSEDVKAKLLDIEEYSRTHSPDEYPEILKRQLTKLEIKGLERISENNVHALITDNKKRALAAL
jgi:hypothetical protein